VKAPAAERVTRHDWATWVRGGKPVSEFKFKPRRPARHIPNAYLVVYTDRDTGNVYPWGYSDEPTGGWAMFTARLCRWATNPRVTAKRPLQHPTSADANP
jgi:hypothetical protein